MSKIINSKEFDELVRNSEEEVLVDFYADWCGPCKMLAPVMDEIGKDKKVYKVNVDDEEDLASEFGVMSIPCIVAFKGGKEVNRTIGLQPKENIENLFK